ncbi:hypothetical protein K7G98_35425, partial [Saccharothrix sp. MB29]|nr:hypothetical protein [Saccharothrix sp. MB29]
FHRQKSDVPITVAPGFHWTKYTLSRHGSISSTKSGSAAHGEASPQVEDIFCPSSIFLVT